jgi:predicted alpha/beta superfamily hydrolase
MANWQDYTAYYTNRPHYVTGTMRVHPDVYSPQLDNYRDVVVYLPPSYRDSDKRYPVLYMHDGQNLFDDHASFSGEWGIDETMELLAIEGLEAIVVGIPNMGLRRLAEYSTFRDERLGGGDGEKYIQFITDTLKPMIDEDARTLPDAAHTGLMGSSMGGLITLSAMCLRPDVFGFAGIMSPSIWFANSAILGKVNQIDFHPSKIYLDVGTKEYADFGENGKTRSEKYVKRMRVLRDALVKKGYKEGESLMYIEEVGGKHAESAWRRRASGAIRFFLTNSKPSN